MNSFLALVIPILIMGCIYLLIQENKGLTSWVERLSYNSSSIWTYGVIAITLLSIIKYLTSTQNGELFTTFTETSSMTLSYHRKHKIYIAATMGYGLGSEDSEELDYYNQIKEKMIKEKEREY